MSPKPEKDFEVSVTWLERRDGSWLLFTRRRFFVTRTQADAAYVEELNANGFLDPGREDIKEVSIEERYQGKRIGRSEGPCTPERTRYWMDRVAEVLANSHGPLAKGLRGMA